MTSEAGRFDGMRLLVPPLDPEHQRHRITLMFGGRAARDTLAEIQRVAHEVGAGGAELVEIDEPSPELFRSELSDESTFTLEIPKTLTDEMEKNFFENEGKDIPRPWHRSYDEYHEGSSFSLPVFLASSLDGGQAKYLIETNEQLNRFQSFNEHFATNQLSSLFEVREFIPTPGDRYTSYRIVMAANGEPIAAGLLYSGHVKGQEKRVEVPTNRTWDRVGDSMLSGLENPISPFFLGARDARSNINQGGSVIPLMGGTNARPVTEKEKTILLDHGIDPADIRIPDTLLQQASLFGANIGKYYGMAVGVDFIQHADTGAFYFLEANGGPGGQTVVECWNGGKENMTVAAGQRAVLERSFANLLINRSFKRQ